MFSSNPYGAKKSLMIYIYTTYIRVHVTTMPSYVLRFALGAVRWCIAINIGHVSIWRATHKSRRGVCVNAMRRERVTVTVVSYRNSCSAAAGVPRRKRERARIQSVSLTAAAAEDAVRVRSRSRKGKRRRYDKTTKTAWKVGGGGGRA